MSVQSRNLRNGNRYSVFICKLTQTIVVVKIAEGHQNILSCYAIFEQAFHFHKHPCHFELSVRKLAQAYILGSFTCGQANLFQLAKVHQRAVSVFHSSKDFQLLSIIHQTNANINAFAKRLDKFQLQSIKSIKVTQANFLPTKLNLFFLQNLDGKAVLAFQIEPIIVTQVLAIQSIKLTNLPILLSLVATSPPILQRF